MSPRPKKGRKDCLPRVNDVQSLEIGVGTKVSFGRQESFVLPAVGVVEKVNRMSYKIRLTEHWTQQRRIYPKDALFRVSKTMVWVRYE